MCDRCHGVYGDDELHIWTLPGLAWVEIESSAMKVNRGLKVLRVAKPAGFPFDRHDLAVNALRGAIGDGVLTVAEDAGRMALQRRGASADGL